MKQAVLRWGGLLAALACGAFLFFVLRVPQAVSALEAKHQQIRALQKGNADLRKEIDEKRDRIRSLRGSGSARELEIRKRLKLQRPGETAIIVPEKSQ